MLCIVAETNPIGKVTAKRIFDLTKKLPILIKKTGIKYTPIFSGARKNDATPHEPLSPEAYTVVKTEVNDVYEIFLATVARNRNMDIELFRATEAGIYQGIKAVDIGLADKIKTMTEIITGGKIMSKSLKVALNEIIKDAKEEDVNKAMDAVGYIPKGSAIPKDEHESVILKNQSGFDKKLEEATAVAKVEGAEEAKKNIVSILELCSIGGVENLALKLVSDGASIEDVKKTIFAKKKPQQNINSTVNPLNAGEVNPMLAEAERRAKEAKK